MRGGKKRRRKAVPAPASSRKRPSPARVTPVDLTRSGPRRPLVGRGPRHQIDDDLREERRVFHQSVIAARDLEESRTRKEPPRSVPPPPDLPDVSNRNAFVPRPHDHGDGHVGRIVVIPEDRETLE